MKKAIFTVAVFLVSTIALAQTTTENYVKTTTYKVETQNGSVNADEKIEQINYFDGLGRAKQSIAVRAGGNGEDIISYFEYDALGRQAKEYLPYAKTTSGSQTLVANPLSELNAFYNTAKYDNTLNPFSEKTFETSPLSRVLKQAAPGADWAMGQGHEIEFQYLTNARHEVKNYTVTLTFANNTYTPTLVLNGAYDTNEIYRTITKDENHSGTSKNHTTEEFKDKLGRVILKRTYTDSDLNGNGTIGSGESQVPHDTYYVYDDYGNLTYVLPPKAEAQSGLPNATALSELCYQYKYDHRNRLVEKKIPGKGWEYIVYNTLDQPVMTQDQNLKSQDKWLFTKYDAFGRVAFTGFRNHTASREALQAIANSSSSMYVERTQTAQTIAGTTIYYDNSPIPFVDEIHTINYYDDYTFDIEGLVPTTAFGIAPTTNVKSLPTGSKVKVLGTSDWITSLTYYDDKQRPIYVASKNDYLQTIDYTITQYDFTGKVIKTETLHTKTDNGQINVQNAYTYDHADRLISNKQRTNMMEIVDAVGVSIDGNTITKTAATDSWWNSGFASTGKLITNGYISFTADENSKVMVGLSEQNSSISYSSIEYAFYARLGVLYVYEYTPGGSSTQKFAGTSGNNGLYTFDDVLSVQRDGDTITYRKNGVVVYTSLTHNTAPLIIDSSIHTSGASIYNLQLYNDHQELIVENVYDELGQLASKNVGNIEESPLQNIDYTYNIRGWLKDINNVSNLGDDLFGFKITYNDPVGGTNLFNGNISQTTWKTNNTDTSTKFYTYSYDALNRLTDAIDNTGKYNLKNVAYDKNGNILALLRKGHIVENPDINTPSDYGNMDDLTYTYDAGNKLQSVDDDLANDTYGFKDGVDITTEYTYDANGNMISDANKGITNISYNHLNLPTEITLLPSGGLGNDIIKYFYDATGNKLKKEVHKVLITYPQVTEYAGNYIYEKAFSSGGVGDNAALKLKFFSHAEGYIEPESNGGYNYVYQYKDHLGNIRLSYMNDKSNAIVIEEDFENTTYDWTVPNGGSLSSNNDKFNVSITDMWQKTYKYLNITPGETVHIEFDFDKGTMVKPYLFVREKIGGVWEPLSNRDTFILQDGHFETDLDLSGDEIQIYFEKGYASDNGTLTTCHIDNLVVTQNITQILEENNYYPFGLKHKGYNNVVNGTDHTYGFQGEEEENELGKNMIAYQWRDYDPAIGRFNKIDRFAEKYVDASPYHFTANNPIAFREIKGDSIKAYFHKKDGSRNNSIPKAVQKMFNEEFGIRVGYNAKTSMLYFEGDVDSELSQSEDATNGLVSALKDDNTGESGTKHGTIKFGYNLRDPKTNSKIKGGAWTVSGGIGKNGATLMDLADFDSNGNSLYFEFSKGLNPRSMNMARIFEHEWFGHGGPRRGAGADGGAYTMGSAVQTTNVFRRQRGLSERLHYGYGSNVIFFGSTSGYGSRRAQTKAARKMVKGKLSNNQFMKIHVRRKN